LCPGLTSWFTPGFTAVMTTAPPHEKQRPTPEQFLAELTNLRAGWADQHGGPAGVAALCSALQTDLARQSEQIAAVRVAAIHELLKTHSGVEVAAMFNISKAAISKIAKSAAWEAPTW